MFWFIIGIILLLVAVGWFAFAPKGRVEETKDYNDRVTNRRKIPSLKPIAVLPLVLGLFLILVSCVSIVGTRNVGVETVWGRPTGNTYGAGWVWKAPWAAVHDIDGTIQPEEYDTNNPIHVKIADLGQAKVALAYRWRINPDHADEAYQNYRNADDITDAIRHALVSTNIKASLNEELGTYNPLQSVVISADMTPSEIAKVTIPPIPYAELNKAVKQNLEAKIADLGGLIEIESVTITYLELPSSTQDKINQFNTKIQESKNALIDIAIKQAQATANTKLSQSVKNDPNVLVSKCLDGLINGEIQNEPGFSCWGTGSSVVVPSK